VRTRDQRGSQRERVVKKGGDKKKKQGCKQRDLIWVGGDPLEVGGTDEKKKILTKNGGGKRENAV